VPPTDPDGQLPIRVLFITRKFPPQVGGMEALSAGVARGLSLHFPTTILAWGRSQRYLPLFVAYAALRGAALLVNRRVDHVHLGDALLAPLGLVLGRLFSVPVTATACGLDVTWGFPGYQAVAVGSLRRLDAVAAISRATLEECVKRGVPRGRCVVIPPGIEPASSTAARDRSELARLADMDLGDRRVLVTVGRLVPRKGVRWFIDEVMSRLPDDIAYLVVGTGPEESAIRSAIARHGLGERVRLLGRLSDDAVAVVYSTSDAFVMPNVVVPGDVEGFGMVAIEAGHAGLPVVAADLQGIADAVVGGAGRLVPAGSAESFAAAIEETLANPPDRAVVRRSVDETFGWPALAERFARFIRDARVHAKAHPTRGLGSHATNR
jgi:phosphatidylinositol alpha-1,6-mannosyltransferase